MFKLWDSRVRWIPLGHVYGQSADILEGPWGSQNQPGSCDLRWFSGPETIILGEDIGAAATVSGVVAEFKIPVDRDLLSNVTQGCIVVACRREHGGLHSAKEDALVRISLNGHPIEFFGLKTEPEGDYTDHFYHSKTQVPAKVDVLEECRTVYPWKFRSKWLAKHGNDPGPGIQYQTLRIELDPGARWDIDYVVLLGAQKRQQLSSLAEGALLGELAGMIFRVILGVVLLVLAYLGCRKMS